MPMPTPATAAKLVRVRKYRRRSTNEENQPYSIEAQDARLDPFISSQDGWVLDGEYADDASGATLDRDGLQRALRDARAGLYDVLLVYRLDRLTRSIRGLLDIVDALNDAEVALVSASEHFDTHTPVGRMVMQILAVFAEFERAIIIDRVVGGMERKAAKGGWTVGPPPFGYALETGPDGKKTGFLVPNEHAPLVGVIFDLYRRKCLGARAIANWLNDQGHRTRKGRRWSHVAVLAILRNRVYIGEIFFRGTWYPAPHRPLVDRKVFDQVQHLLVERGDDHPTQVASSSDYDLAGLIRCPHCNKRYLGNAAHGRSGRYRYYTCYSRQRFGTDACPADRLPADRLEAAVIRALLETYQRTDLFDQAVAQAHTNRKAHLDHYRGELATVRAKRRDTGQAIDRYLAAFERGIMPEDVCGPRLVQLRAEQTQLQTRERHLGGLLATNTPRAPDPALLAVFRRHIRDGLMQGNAEARKALLRTLVAEIVVESRNTIRPFFKVPTLTSGVGFQRAVREVEGVVAPTGFEPALPP